MFKRVLALALAAIMLLMPMTASAVTWDTIMTSLRTSNAYKDGSTTATVNGDTITVSGGDVQDIVIHDGGKYVLNGISIQGSSLVLSPYDGQLIDLTLDKDTKFDTSYGGLNIFFSGDNSEARIHNDTTIVGPWESFFIDFVGEGNKVTVDGDGTIHYSTNDDSKFNRTPVKVWVYEDSQMDIDSVKKAVLMQQNIALTEGMPLMVLETYKQGSDVPKTTGKYFVDLNGALYRINDDGTQTLIDPNFILLEEDEEEEEEEPEPDPVEEQRQAEAIGGVTTSPVWNWQGYLGHSSKPMWIYVNGEKTMMRQRLFWLPDSTKNHTCRINVDAPDPASVELRIGLDMLRTAQRAEISVITILDSENNPIAQFAVSDLLGAFEQYGLVEGELLCVSGDANAEVMKVNLSGEYLPLEEQE